jgi:hypothetical protein
MQKAPTAPTQTLSPQWSTRLDCHFAACSAAALGAAAWFSSQSQARAEVVYSGLVNLPIFPSAVNGGVYFDLENPANFAQGTRPAGWDMNPYQAGWSIYMGRPSTGVVLATPDTAADLPLGTLIDGTQSFSGITPYNTGFYGDSGIPTGATGYLGFRFDPESVAGVQTWYGWLRMTAGNNTTGVNGNVLDWAYDNTGAGIMVGQVPEPSALSLLAMGAAGMLALRRRRTQV